MTRVELATVWAHCDDRAELLSDIDAYARTVRNQQRHADMELFAICDVYTGGECRSRIVSRIEPEDAP